MLLMPCCGGGSCVEHTLSAHVDDLHQRAAFGRGARGQHGTCCGTVLEFIAHARTHACERWRLAAAAEREIARGPQPSSFALSRGSHENALTSQATGAI